MAVAKSVQDFFDQHDPRECPGDQGPVGTDEEAIGFCAICGAPWSDHDPHFWDEAQF